jgi:hypothetical protein
MNELKVYKENPRKRKSEKVLDTESSLWYNITIIKKGEIDNAL